jgi:hypothetical protein
MVGSLQTSIAYIARITVIEGITWVESISIVEFMIAAHGILHVPWLARMATKWLPRVRQGIARVVMESIPRLAGVAKRVTFTRIVTTVRDNLMMRFPRRVTLVTIRDTLPMKFPKRVNLTIVVTTVRNDLMPKLAVAWRVTLVRVLLDTLMGVMVGRLWWRLMGVVRVVSGIRKILNGIGDLRWFLMIYCWPIIVEFLGQVFL